MNRRRVMNLLGLGALAASSYGCAAVLRRVYEPDLEFVDIPNLPGFRALRTGQISAASGVFAGLSEAPTTELHVFITDICDALFTQGTGRVPVAYFSDARCGICRTLSPELARTDGITLSHHSLPLLGRISQIAAQAEEAADVQGARRVFHQRLMGSTVLPNRASLTDLAVEAGIDPDRLLRDMQGLEVRRRLATSKSLAEMFGFFGTPALVIGRTAVLGRPDLKRMIALERNETEPGRCQGLDR